MGLTDLRDDVSGFFKRLRKKKREVAKEVVLKQEIQYLQFLILRIYSNKKSTCQLYLKHLSNLCPLLCCVL